ncbi:ABC transporter permease [Companilactobacillus metriopterae]|uniref:ABC transporter permease n=1 Tax=Companilactobacillus metriopterae TaxID=1909267 RepID=UPI00100BF0E8|nr:ABC transporter permease [Companilactobacillus metriopterae]
MQTNFSHELFKFTNRHVPRYGIIILFLLMVYTAIPTNNISSNIVAQGFSAGQWICIIIIALASDTITMEYRNNTMSTIVYKSKNKISVYISKLFVLIIYGVLLLVIGVLFSFLIKFLAARSKFSWLSTYHEGHSLLNSLLLNMGGTAIYLLFIITLSMLLISLFKNNATVIIIGLAIAFLGADLSNVLIAALPNLKSILAWNPFNMINVINQLSGVNSSHLSNIELIVGNIVYSILFLILGFWTFKKRPI